MLISPQHARDLLADLTRTCPMRLATAALGTRGFHHHGHVFFGDTALEGHKAKNRWWFVAEEVEQAGRTLAGLRLEPGDLVEVHLPVRQPGEVRGDKGSDWLGPDTNWRREIVSWMGNAAFHELEPEGDWDLLHTVNLHGLPGALTMEAFRARFGKMVRAGTYPLDHMTWTGTSWQMPREYVEVMDRWQARDNELLEQARICRGCGSLGPRYGAWRAPTPRGYVTLCPACSVAACEPYTGQLAGVAYTSVPRTTRPARFLCRMCGLSRAFTWDHCHDHGLVRGPLCASCNTYEGKGVRFLERPGALALLLDCPACERKQTLPERFRVDIATEHVRRIERHGRCPSRPRVQDTTPTHSGLTFTLGCTAHNTVWSRSMTAAEIAAVVAAFVTAGPATAS
ncbi:endonuclease domain-containing protein [Streptomyces sp. NPDC001668]|uniref:endonuclease domain-containing protein n=1 Tax=Streptomyces sp. NPDC001668 TaxID=3364598 RepID=UPI0036963ED3